MKKFFYLIAFASFFTFAACDSDSDSDEKLNDAWDVYFLNEGSWGKNNASISARSSMRSAFADDIYLSQNGQNLGDVAQDLVYDDKNHQLFVSVTESRYIAKLDYTGKELMRYSTTAEVGQPRSLLLEDGFLYVSMYGDENNGGWVAKLDTASLRVINKVRVGFYPEGIAEEDDILAVCNSGYGMGQTVSLIDLKNFSLMGEVTLPYPNPQGIVECCDKFYCNTTEYDEYWNAVNRIVEIDPKTRQTKYIADAFYMAEDDDKLYLVKSETNYATTPYSYSNTLMEYLPKSGKLSELQATSQIKNLGVYGLSVADNGDVYIFANNQSGAEYTHSSILIFDRNFNLREELFSGGVLTKKAVFAD